MSAKLITSNKELRLVIKEAEGNGWAFTKTRKHIKGLHKATGQTTTISQTPSDGRALENIKRWLRIREAA